MSENTQIAIESTLQETRIFPPPPEFSANAHIKSFAEYEQIYAQAAENPEEFWASAAEKFSFPAKLIRWLFGYFPTLL